MMVDDSGASSACSNTDETCEAAAKASSICFGRMVRPGLFGMLDPIQASGHRMEGRISAVEAIQIPDNKNGHGINLPPRFDGRFSATRAWMT